MNYSVVICGKDGSVSKACDAYGRPFCTNDLSRAKAKITSLIETNKGVSFIERYEVRAWMSRSDVYQVVYYANNDSTVIENVTLYTKEGYYARMYGFDCFYITNQQRKSSRLAVDFANKVQNRLNAFTNIGTEGIGELMSVIVKATMSKIQLKRGSYAGKYYISIQGENFGGYGSPCPSDNPEANIIIVEG